MGRSVGGFCGAAAVALLGACGGGGGGGRGGGGDPAESLAQKASFSDADIAHLLSRTAFGGTAAEAARARAIGVPAFVTEMISPPAEPALEAEAKTQLWHVNDDPDRRGFFPAFDSTPRWWLHLMVHTAHPFRDELALFWHDHFATSTAVVDSSAETHWMVEQLEMLRAQGAGNLRTLLLAIARDPMMLRFLDGVLSTAAAPNENLPREFWELFTLGVDNGYTQADIVESARALTGFRARFGANGQKEVVFDPTRHDPGAKSLLGVTIPAQNVGDDCAAVVDATVDRRPVAEFVCRRLFEHFVHRAPSDALVAALAQRLRDQGYELAPLLRTLFLSEAFYAAPARAGLVRTPVQQIVGFARQTGLVPFDAHDVAEPPDATPNTLRTLDRALLQAGQRVSQPPSVNGWPQDRQWLSAQGVLDRVNAVLAFTADRDDQAAAGMDVLPLIPANPTGATAADALLALLHVRASPAQRALYVAYLDTALDGASQEVASPLASADADERRARVRGLLWILAQHPSFFVR